MPTTRSAVPRRAGLLVAAVVHGVLVASATAVLDGLGRHEGWDWGEFAERAALYGVAAWAVVALQRPLQRFFGAGRPEQERRREADLAVNRAVWTGVLPEDVDPVRWRQQVARWLRELQIFRALYAIAALVIGGLVALTAVRVDDGDRGVLALGAVLVLAAPALLVATRGPVGRARELRDGQLPVA